MALSAGSDEQRLNLCGVCLREIFRTNCRYGGEREESNYQYESKRHAASGSVLSFRSSPLTPQCYVYETTHLSHTLLLNFRQRLLGITKTVVLDAHFVHHAKVEPAHLPVGVAAVIQILAALDLTARTAQHHNG